jgi:hypothetical protein
MKATARRISALLLVAVVVPALLPGCIVWLDDPWCSDYPPRMATVQVYVRDLYTGAPIPWAQVELYERDWWDWDYIGRWPVSPSGYVTVFGGYLYHDSCGGSEREDFRVVVYADGYYSDFYQVELSYYHPWETLTFYMMPWYGAERPGSQGDAVPDEASVPEEGTFQFSDDESGHEKTAKVIVGEEEQDGN